MIDVDIAPVISYSEEDQGGMGEYHTGLFELSDKAWAFYKKLFNLDDTGTPWVDGGNDTYTISADVLGLAGRDKPGWLGKRTPSGGLAVLDIESAREQLKAAGVKIVEEKKTAHSHALLFNDPDKNLIAVFVINHDAVVKSNS